MLCCLCAVLAFKEAVSVMELPEDAVEERRASVIGRRECDGGEDGGEEGVRSGGERWCVNEEKLCERRGVEEDAVIEERRVFVVEERSACV